jgi:hypothetical protein
MHTKIIKHPNDSNVLTQVLGSKTNLGMQHIHLELPLILGYSFKKTKHNSRLNTSAKYKMVINSPEVHFGIKRPHAEVGHKNIIIFSYKKSSRLILHKWKTIHIKRFTI